MIGPACQAGRANHARLLLPSSYWRERTDGIPPSAFLDREWRRGHLGHGQSLQTDLAQIEHPAGAQKFEAPVHREGGAGVPPEAMTP